MSFLKLFIIGVPKGGTTSLFYYLSKHPAICASKPKETHFFDSINFEKNDIDFFINEYFLNKEGKSILCEATPSYLYLPYVAKRLYERLPGSKLVVILRDPIERAFSNWWMDYSHGIIDLTFYEAIKKNFERMDKGIFFNSPKGPRLWQQEIEASRLGKKKFFTYIDFGYYDEQLISYYEYFDKEQIYICFFEEFIKNPIKILNDIFEFLGIKKIEQFENLRAQNVSMGIWEANVFRLAKKLKLNKIMPSYLKKYSFNLIKGKGNKPILEEKLRDQLIDHYLHRMLNLRNLLNRTLPFKNFKNV